MEYLHTYCWKLCSAPDECVLFHTKLISLFQSPLLSHLHSALPSSSLSPHFTHYKSSLTLFQLFSSLLFLTSRLLCSSFFRLPFLLICSSFHFSSPTFCTQTTPHPRCRFLSLSPFFLPVVWLPWCWNGGIFIVGRCGWGKKSISGCADMIIILTEKKFRSNWHY